jgi:hypothetical protein
MADLQLSSAVLEELTAAFGGFADRLAHARTAISSADADLEGTDPLAGQVHAFSGSWNYGITQLGQHGADCVTMLRRVGSTFDRLDQQLAASLAQRKAQG